MNWFEILSSATDWLGKVTAKTRAVLIGLGRLACISIQNTIAAELRLSVAGLIAGSRQILCTRSIASSVVAVLPGLLHATKTKMIKTDIWIDFLSI